MATLGDYIQKTYLGNAPKAPGAATQSATRHDNAALGIGYADDLIERYGADDELSDPFAFDSDANQIRNVSIPQAIARQYADPVERQRAAAQAVSAFNRQVKAFASQRAVSDPAWDRKNKEARADRQASVLEREGIRQADRIFSDLARRPDFAESSQENRDKHLRAYLANTYEPWLEAHKELDEGSRRAIATAFADTMREKLRAYNRAENEGAGEVGDLSNKLDAAWQNAKISFARMFTTDKDLSDLEGLSAELAEAYADRTLTDDQRAARVAALRGKIGKELEEYHDSVEYIEGLQRAAAKSNASYRELARRRAELQRLYGDDYVIGFQNNSQGWLSLISSIAESAPQMLATSIAGIGAGALGSALSTPVGGWAAGSAAIAAVGAYFGGRNAVSSIVDAISEIDNDELMAYPEYKELRETYGLNEKQAKTVLALYAAQDSGAKVAGQIFGGVTALVGPEALIAKTGAFKALLNSGLAKRLAKTRLGRSIKGFGSALASSASEGLQEGGEQIISNLGEMAYNPERGLGDSFLNSALAGAVLSGPFSAAGGVRAYRDQAPTQASEFTDRGAGAEEPNAPGGDTGGPQPTQPGQGPQPQPVGPQPSQPTQPGGPQTSQPTQSAGPQPSQPAQPGGQAALAARPQNEADAYRSIQTEISGVQVPRATAGAAPASPRLGIESQIRLQQAVEVLRAAGRDDMFIQTLLNAPHNQQLFTVDEIMNGGDFARPATLDPSFDPAVAVRGITDAVQGAVAGNAQAPAQPSAATRAALAQPIADLRANGYTTDQIQRVIDRAMPNGVANPAWTVDAIIGPQQQPVPPMGGAGAPIPPAGGAGTGGAGTGGAGTGGAGTGGAGTGGTGTGSAGQGAGTPAQPGNGQGGAYPPADTTPPADGIQGGTNPPTGPNPPADAEIQRRMAVVSDALDKARAVLDNAYERLNRPEVFTPDQLTTGELELLRGQMDLLAQNWQGHDILTGGAAPDLDEISAELLRGFATDLTPASLAAWSVDSVRSAQGTDINEVAARANLSVAVGNALDAADLRATDPDFANITRTQLSMGLRAAVLTARKAGLSDTDIQAIIDSESARASNRPLGLTVESILGETARPEYDPEPDLQTVREIVDAVADQTAGRTDGQAWTHIYDPSVLGSGDLSRLQQAVTRLQQNGRQVPLPPGWDTRRILSLTPWAQYEAGSLRQDVEDLLAALNEAVTPDQVADAGLAQRAVQSMRAHGLDDVAINLLVGANTPADNRAWTVSDIEALRAPADSEKPQYKETGGTALEESIHRTEWEHGDPLWRPNDGVARYWAARLAEYRDAYLRPDQAQWLDKSMGKIIETLGNNRNADSRRDARSGVAAAIYVARMSRLVSEALGVDIDQALLQVGVRNVAMRQSTEGRVTVTHPKDPVTGKRRVAIERAVAIQSRLFMGADPMLAVVAHEFGHVLVGTLCDPARVRRLYEQCDAGNPAAIQLRDEWIALYRALNPEGDARYAFNEQKGWGGGNDVGLTAEENLAQYLASLFSQDVAVGQDKALGRVVPEGGVLRGLIQAWMARLMDFVTRLRIAGADFTATEGRRQASVRQGLQEGSDSWYDKYRRPVENAMAGAVPQPVRELYAQMVRSPLNNLNDDLLNQLTAEQTAALDMYASAAIAEKVVGGMPVGEAWNSTQNELVAFLSKEPIMRPAQVDNAIGNLRPASRSAGEVADTIRDAGLAQAARRMAQVAPRVSKGSTLVEQLDADTARDLDDVVGALRNSGVAEDRIDTILQDALPQVQNITAQTVEYMANTGNTYDTGEGLGAAGGRSGEPANPQPADIAAAQSQDVANDLADAARAQAAGAGRAGGEAIRALAEDARALGRAAAILGAEPDSGSDNRAVAGGGAAAAAGAGVAGRAAGAGDPHGRDPTGFGQGEALGRGCVDACRSISDTIASGRGPSARLWTRRVASPAPIRVGAGANLADAIRDNTVGMITDDAAVASIPGAGAVIGHASPNPHQGMAHVAAAYIDNVCRQHNAILAAARKGNAGAARFDAAWRANYLSASGAKDSAGAYDPASWDSTMVGALADRITRAVTVGGNADPTLDSSLRAYANLALPALAGRVDTGIDPARLPHVSYNMAQINCIDAYVGKRASVTLGTVTDPTPAQVAAAIEEANRYVTDTIRYQSLGAYQAQAVASQAIARNVMETVGRNPYAASMDAEALLDPAMLSLFSDGTDLAREANGFHTADEDVVLAAPNPMEGYGDMPVPPSAPDTRMDAEVVEQLVEDINTAIDPALTDGAVRTEEEPWFTEWGAGVLTNANGDPQIMYMAGDRVAAEPFAGATPTYVRTGNVLGGAPRDPALAEIYRKGRDGALGDADRQALRDRNITALRYGEDLRVVDPGQDCSANVRDAVLSAGMDAHDLDPRGIANRVSRARQAVQGLQKGNALYDSMSERMRQAVDSVRGKPLDPGTVSTLLAIEKTTAGFTRSDLETEFPVYDTDLSMLDAETVEGLAQDLDAWPEMEGGRREASVDPYAAGSAEAAQVLADNAAANSAHLRDAEASLRAQNARLAGVAVHPAQQMTKWAQRFTKARHFLDRASHFYTWCALKDAPVTGEEDSGSVFTAFKNILANKHGAKQAIVRDIISPLYTWINQQAVALKVPADQLNHAIGMAHLCRHVIEVAPKQRQALIDAVANAAASGDAKAAQDAMKALTRYMNVQAGQIEVKDCAIPGKFHGPMGGMTVAEAMAMLDSLEQAYGFSALDEGLRRSVAAQRQLVLYGIDHNVFTETDVARFGDWTYYCPFYTSANNREGPSNDAEAPLSLQPRLDYLRDGSTTPANDAISNLLVMADKIAGHVGANDFVLALKQRHDTLPVTGATEVAGIPVEYHEGVAFVPADQVNAVINGAAPEGVRRMAENLRAGSPLRARVPVIERTRELDPVTGQAITREVYTARAYYVVMEDPQVAEAMRAPFQQDDGDSWHWVRRATGMYAGFNTTWRPAFAPINAMRDWEERWVWLAGHEFRAADGSRIAGMRAAGKMLSASVAATLHMPQIARALWTGRDDMGTEFGRTFSVVRKIMRNASFNNLIDRQVNEAQRQLRPQVEPSRVARIIDSNPVTRTAADVTKGLYRALRFWAECWYTIPVYAQYSALRKCGMSEADAQADAIKRMDLSTRVGRPRNKGAADIMGAVECLYPFVSSINQTTLQMASFFGLGVSTFGGHAKHGDQMRQAMRGSVIFGASVAAFGFLIPMVAAMCADPDDPDDDGYRFLDSLNISELTYLPIPLGDGTYYKHQWGFGVFNYAGQFAMALNRLGRDKITVAQAAADLSLSVLHNTSPVGTPTYETHNAQDALAKITNSVAPAIVAPLVQLATNVNYFGTPIDPGERYRKPGERASDAYAPKIPLGYRDFAQAVYDLTGSWCDFSAYQWRHLLMSYIPSMVGGVARAVEAGPAPEGAPYSTTTQDLGVVMGGLGMSMAYANEGNPHRRDFYRATEFYDGQMRRWGLAGSLSSTGTGQSAERHVDSLLRIAGVDRNMRNDLVMIQKTDRAVKKLNTQAKADMTRALRRGAPVEEIRALRAKYDQEYTALVSACNRRLWFLSDDFRQSEVSQPTREQLDAARDWDSHLKMSRR